VAHHRLRFGPVELKGALNWPDGTPGIGVAPRRFRLDALLVEAAAEAGAEVRQGYSVLDLLWEGDRVVGIRGHQGEERAQVVVGADGMRSLVASSVGAPIYADLAPLTCCYYSHWADLPTDALEVHALPGQLAIVFPTDDQLTCVAVCWSADQFPTVRANLEAEFLLGLESWPDLSQRVQAGRRVERFQGTPELPFFLRKPCGPGWALVGDAACRVDPITAQGITDALRDVDLLADALTSGLGGGSLENQLTEYHRRRDEAVMPIYRFTSERARLAPPSPEMQRLVGALKGNQQQTDRFIGLTAGTTLYADFFSPTNLEALFGAPAAA
jgi:flavin-dependent dehydrogenase